MILKFELIKTQDYRDRIRFWPNEIEIKDRNNFFTRDKETVFNGTGANNFWRLSEQYYSIAWTLWTAAFNERIKWPYIDNIADEKDEKHKKLLCQSISDNSWTAPTFLSFAHLSCELAFKTIIFHKSTEVNLMSYPKGHDLKDLMNEFDAHTKNSFITQYNDWEDSQNLDDIINDSDVRFVEQRYGNYEFNSKGLGVINLCRFIHEFFNLENIPGD
tara:strand:- start:1263 stop:1910 length:648 start_codon:yes stop_codon:yes gene_type:complete